MKLISDAMDSNKIDEIAKRIVSLKLGAPCMFLLEAHLPFSSAFHTAVIAVEPLAAPFLGFKRVNFLSDLLSERENVELLINAIEREQQGAS